MNYYTATCTPDLVSAAGIVSRAVTSYLASLGHTMDTFTREVVLEWGTLCRDGGEIEYLTGSQHAVLGVMAEMAAQGEYIIETFEKEFSTID